MYNYLNPDIMNLKKLFLILSLPLLLASCNEVSNVTDDDGEGVMDVSVEGLPLTKASTESYPGEMALHDTQVFLFRSADGMLYRKEAISGDATTMTVKRLKADDYDVVVVCNMKALLGEDGDLNPISKAELENTALTLAMCDPEKGFVMYGEQDGVTVTKNSGSSSGQSGSAAKATVTVSRFAARVRLISVRNEIPDAFGDLTIDYAFLENGYGTWTLDGRKSASGLYAVSEPVNWAGRREGHSNEFITEDNNIVIDSSADAMYPDQTFRSLGGRVIHKGATEGIGAALYSLPNPAENITDQEDGPATTTQPAYLRLVVHATFGNGGRGYFYPVTILGGPDINKAVTRNTTYDVSLTIRGAGVDDPNNVIRHGNIDITFTVEPWGEGSDINKIY